eukprot:Pgem_evm1s14152
MDNSPTTGLSESVDDIPLNSIFISKNDKRMNGEFPTNIDFTIRLKVMGYTRLNSLKRLILSLDNADYGNHTVPLEFYLDIPEDSQKLTSAQECINYVDNFEWKYGPKLMHVRAKNGNLQTQWLEHWWPANDHEYAYVCEDDMEVSPFFYSYLRKAIIKYQYTPENYDPSLYGIAISRLKLLPALSERKKGRTIKPSSHQPFMNPLIGTWGQLLFPRPWKEFRWWYQNRRFLKGKKPYLGNMVTDDWYRAVGETIWTPWFIKFVYANNYYNLYTSFPNNGALSVSYQDVGVSYKKSGGADSYLIREVPKENSPGWSLPPIEKIIKYNYCFQNVGTGINLATAGVYENDLKKLAKAAADKTNSVYLMYASSSMDTMLRNFLCHVSKIEFGLILFVVDEKEYGQKLQTEGRLVYFLKATKGTHNVLLFGDKNYRLAMLERSIAVEQLLSYGYNTIVIDADIALLKDPTLYLQGNYDIIGQFDHPKYFCGGFLKLFSTTTTISVWQQVIKKFKEGIVTEQKKINEQILLFTIVEKMIKDGTIKSKFLSRKLFVNGKGYTDDKVDVSKAELNQK